MTIAFDSGESREVVTGLKCLTWDIIEVCDGVRDSHSHRQVHEIVITS